jgi:DNA-binding response OmpR family regulator
VLFADRRAADVDEGQSAQEQVQVPVLVIVEPNPERGGDLSADLQGYGYVTFCIPDSWVNHFAQRLAAVLLGPSLSLLRMCQLCATIREQTDVPIIALLEEPQADAVSLILDAGADHVVPCPSRGVARVVMSAISSTRRRESLAQRPEQEVVEVGPLRINLERRTVEVDGSPIPLTATEFGILALLARNAGRLISPVDILHHVHGYQTDGAEAQDIIKVHISRLRQKLEADPAASRCIVNIRGQGYVYMFDRRGAGPQTHELEGNEPPLRVLPSARSSA